MSLGYTEDLRLIFTFGPSSKFSKLIAKYLPLFQAQFDRFEPKEASEKTFDNFLEDLDPDWSMEQYGVENNEEPNAFPIPSGFEVIEMNVNLGLGYDPKLTLQDMYTVDMALEIAIYLELRLNTTALDLAAKAEELSLDPLQSRKVTALRKAEKRVEELRDGLEDAVLRFEFHGSDAYVQDLRNEPVYRHFC